MVLTVNAWLARTLLMRLALGAWGAYNAPASLFTDDAHHSRVGLRHPSELQLWLKSALPSGLTGNRRSSKEGLLDGREEVPRHGEGSHRGLCKSSINLHCGA